MHITTTMLRYFVEVARSGQLSAAAAALNRSPSAVSMMLKQFEAELGAPLFKGERKNELTELGQFAYDEALRELAHFDRSVVNMAKFARSNRSVLRIAAAPSLGAFLLPPAIHALNQAGQTLALNISDMPSLDIIGNLNTGRLDLGIVGGVSQMAFANLQATALFDDPLGVVCAPSHRFSQWSSVSLADISAEEFIDNPLLNDTDLGALTALREASRLHVRNSLSLRSFIQSGLGLSILPKLLVAQFPGSLHFVPLGDARIERKVYVLRNGELKASQALFDAILKSAAHPPSD